MRAARPNTDHRYVARAKEPSFELEFGSVDAARRAQIATLEAGYAAVLVGERRVEVFVGSADDIEATRRGVLGLLRTSLRISPTLRPLAT
jgi:hypothetical protein